MAHTTRADPGNREYWGRLSVLCWMVAHLAARRGYCPRGPLRVMYADLFPDDVMRSPSKAGSVGKYSSRKLGEDLRTLSEMGIVERRDVRVVVSDWDRLTTFALQAHRETAKPCNTRLV